MKPESIYIIIEGVPVPKGRPRFARRGKFVTTYTPDKTRNYESKIEAAGRKAIGLMIPFDEAIKLVMSINLPIPASMSKKNRELAITGVLRPTKRPDYDNFAKCLDALNGVVFKDDSQIVDVEISKYYSESPSLEIWLYPVIKPSI